MNENKSEQLPFDIPQYVYKFLDAKDIARILMPACKDNLTNGIQEIIQRFLNQEANNDDILFIENHFATHLSRDLSRGRFECLLDHLKKMFPNVPDIIGYLYRSSLAQKKSQPTSVLFVILIILKAFDTKDQERNKHYCHN